MSLRFDPSIRGIDPHPIPTPGVAAPSLLSSLLAALFGVLGASADAVYLGFFGIRLSGQFDILRLMTRGLVRSRRGGRTSRQKVVKASASRLGGKSRAPAKRASGGPEGPCERKPQGIFVEVVGDTADKGADRVVHA